MVRFLPAALLFAACGFPALEPAGANAAASTLTGILISPTHIRPGDKVVLRDPTPIDPTRVAPAYFWDACDGELSPGPGIGQEMIWTAPATPGVYQVTLNVANDRRANASLVIPLCVSAGDDCAPGPAALVSTGLNARPDLVVQGPACGGSCITTLKAGVEVPAGETARYRWVIRRGNLEESETSTVQWHLPTAGCCTESHTAAFTACTSGGAAATGFTHVTVFPE